MGLNLVNNTNYGFVGEKTGTFTPNFTPDSFMNDTVLSVRQVGNIVYLSGFLRIDGTWSDLGGSHLGDITGVGVPISQTPSPWSMPIVTWNNDGTTFHSGYLSVRNDGNGVTRVSVTANVTDMGMFINGFYFTE